jgi:hypothetical protein
MGRMKKEFSRKVHSFVKKLRQAQRKGRKVSDTERLTTLRRSEASGFAPAAMPDTMRGTARCAGGTEALRKDRNEVHANPGFA